MHNQENPSQQATNITQLEQHGANSVNKLQVTVIGSPMFGDTRINVDALSPLINITTIAADHQAINAIISAEQADLLVIDLDVIDETLFNTISAHAIQTQLQVFFLTSTVPAKHADSNQPLISFLTKSDALSNLIEKLNGLSHQKVALTDHATARSRDQTTSKQLVDRIAADMHDAVGGLLSSMMLILYTQKEAINNGEVDHQHMHAQLSTLEDMVEQTSSEIKRVCNQHK